MKNYKEQSTITDNDINIDKEYSNLFDSSSYSTIAKLENFPKQFKRQDH